ncbi:MAG: cation:proton antiporter, partial [Thermoplasmatota archaeon]
MAVPLVVGLAALGLGLALAGWLAHLVRLPPIVGYMALGLAAARPLAAPLPPGALAGASRLAVIPVLFFIGLELDLKRIRDAVRGALLSLPLDLAVPVLVVAGAARLFGWSVPTALMLGLAGSLSSTLLGERLTNIPGVGPEARRRSLGVLLAEDLGAPILLALVVLAGTGAGDWLGATGHVAALVVWFLVLTAVALLVLPRVLDALARTHRHELLVLGTLGAAAGLAAVGEWVGSLQLGALVAGIAAAEAGSRFVVRNALDGIRHLALAAFFFAAGAQVDPAAALAAAPLAAVVALLFVVSKVLVHVPAGLAAGLTPEGALAGAFALSTMGEFNLILVAAAEAVGAPPALRATIVAATLALLVAGPLLVMATPRIMAAAGRRPRLRWLGVSLAESLARARGRGDAAVRRTSVRALAANVLLLAAWLSLAAAVGDRAAARVGAAVVFGVILAVAFPILYGVYRSYRDLVRSVAHAEGQEEGSRLRSRLVDAWVAATAALLLLPVSFLAPRALPALAGGLVVAAILVALAGRQWVRFHAALSESMVRVLGQEAAS